MSETSMEDILSDKEPEKPQPAETQETVDTSHRKREQWREREAIAQGKERDPNTGQFVQKKESPPVEAKEEPKEAPKEVVKEAPKEAPKQEFSDKERGLLRAAEEERRKRQELERKLAELQTKPQEPPKTFWDDPEGQLNKVKQEMQQAVLQTKVHTSETIARSKYQDYDKNIEVFGQIVQETPGLVQQWLASPDPAEFAYRLGKNHRELKEAGGLDELRAKMELEIRGKIEKELKEKEEKLKAERAALPTSLSQAKGTSVNRVVWGGPTPMDDILANK